VQRKQEADARASSDSIHYYQVDHLGTPLELFDQHGNSVWEARYKAWGSVWRFDAEQIKQPLRFQGQYWDEESGLHYNRHRYYDPVTGRFVTQDPIGLDGGHNLYQYVPNPAGLIDPLGLKMRSAKTVRFSQDGYSASFGNGGCVNELAYHLKDSPAFAAKIEPIRLVRFKDLPSDVQTKLTAQGANSNMVFSLDNRRLAAAKQAGVDVNSRWATSEEIRKEATIRRFSTKNAGKSACLN
jgi:RHS repeat-associated protein